MKFLKVILQSLPNTKYLMKIIKPTNSIKEEFITWSLEFLHLRIRDEVYVTWSVRPHPFHVRYQMFEKSTKTTYEFNSRWRNLMRRRLFPSFPFTILRSETLVHYIKLLTQIMIRYTGTRSITKTESKKEKHFTSIFSILLIYFIVKIRQVHLGWGSFTKSLMID